MSIRRPPEAVTDDRGRTARSIAASISLATVLVLALLVSLSGCKQASNEVIIKDLRFNPKVLTVTTGTTVTWKNEDQTAHTVTSDMNDVASAPADQKFKSKILNPGDTFTHTFDTAAVAWDRPEARRPAIPGDSTPEPSQHCLTTQCWHR